MAARLKTHFYRNKIRLRSAHRFLSAHHNQQPTSAITRMIKVCRIGHATFETPDLDKAIEHYTEAVGLILNSRTADSAYLMCRLGQLSMELQRGPERRCRRLSFEVAADLGLCRDGTLAEKPGHRQHPA